MKIFTHPLLLGSLLMAIAVMLGAFGAHALKDVLIGKYLHTYQTGIEYHYYHALGLLILGLIQNSYPQMKLKISKLAFSLGILFFSFNCYFYALTQNKVFAMLVPIGGVLFIVGWLHLSYRLLKEFK